TRNRAGTREEARRLCAGGPSLLLLYQRTGAFRKRPEGLIAGGGSDQLVIVPWPLGFGRLLDLEQVGRMNLAGVGADRAITDKRIGGRVLFSYSYNLRPT